MSDSASRWPPEPSGTDSDGGSPAPDDYVGIATVHGPTEEGLICAFLESNGIPARTRGEAIRKIHGITVDGIGAAEIEVPARFADHARELLATAERGELKITDDFEEDA